MKKRNIVLSVILAGTALCGSSVMAKTYAYEHGGKTFYISEYSEETESLSGLSNEIAVEYALSDPLSEAEKAAAEVLERECIASYELGAALSGEYDAVLEDVQIEVATASEDSYEESVEDKRKAQEYEENGIARDADGCWLWNGKLVHLLMDEDGSFYQNGSEEAKDNKIYLIVKRSKDGGIDTVKEAMAEEVLKER